MKKEIEVKAKVAHLAELQDKFIKLGVQFSEPIIQEDETFVDSNYGEYDQIQLNKNYLRIRKQKDTYFFTLKQPQMNELDCIEKETEISNPDEFREALLLMGYVPMIHIYKKRTKAKYLDYEICLDEVQDLGDYVEIEKITDSANVEDVQKELFDFLKKLGIEDKDRENRGYDTLIYIKNK